MAFVVLCVTEDANQFKVSSYRLVEPGIKLGTPGYKTSDLSTTPWQLTCKDTNRII